MRWAGLSLCLVASPQSQALQALAQALDELPGAFGGEAAVVYHAGVSEGVEHWSCEIEADIPSSNIQAWGHTPDQAVRDALALLEAEVQGAEGRPSSNEQRPHRGYYCRPPGRIARLLGLGHEGGPPQQG